MIFFVDGGKLNDLLSLVHEENIYACKIACLIESYELKYDFAEFWVQYVNEKPVTAISKFYGDMTICSTDKTDFDELKEFLKVTGFYLLKSCKSDTFEVPEYEDFILDMSHKIRHDTALCVGVREGEKLVSTAMTVAQSKTCAVIGAVATDGNHRHSGYGSQCVNAICRLLNDRKIFIMRDERENEDFYRSMGFEDKGKFYIKRGKKYDTVL